MDQEPDVIRQQIDQTRSSLTEKLESLEQEVRGTVESAKATVEQTIENVKSTVQDTVQTVKRTFDLNYQVDRHPWAMVGGSVVAGFVVGNLLPRRHGRPAGLFRPAGFGARPAREAPSPSQPLQGDGRTYAAPPSTPPAAQPAWFDWLRQQFEPELEQVKAIAIGTALGLVRDVVKGTVPQPLATQVDEIMNSVTAKLGGQPIQQPLVSPETVASTFSPRRTAL